MVPFNLVLFHGELALDLLHLHAHIFYTALLLHHLLLQAFVLLLLSASLLIKSAEISLQLAQRGTQLSVLCLALLQPFFQLLEFLRADALLIHPI